jgi:hypothetical protein
MLDVVGEVDLATVRGEQIAVAVVVEASDDVAIATIAEGVGVGLVAVLAAHAAVLDVAEQRRLAAGGVIEIAVGERRIAGAELANAPVANALRVVRIAGVVAEPAMLRARIGVRLAAIRGIAVASAETGSTPGLLPRHGNDHVVRRFSIEVELHGDVDVRQVAFGARRRVRHLEPERLARLALDRQVRFDAQEIARIARVRFVANGLDRELGARDVRGREVRQARRLVVDAEETHLLRTCRHHAEVELGRLLASVVGTALVEHAQLDVSG